MPDKKMSKLVEKFHERNLLTEGEEFIGAFIGRHIPTLSYLIGPLASVFMMRQYQVVVSNRRIFFAKLSPLGRLDDCDAFEYNEVKVAKCIKKMLRYRLQFIFKNGRKLKLDANYRGPGRVEGYLLSPKVLDVLGALQK